MSFTLRRISLLDGEAVLPLADAKAHIVVEHEIDDALIAQLRDAAITHIEKMSGIALAPSRFRWTIPCFFSTIELPVRPATNLEEVAFLDSQAAFISYTGARLVENKVLPSHALGWPSSSGPIVMTFMAGLSAPDEAPDLLAAVKLLLGHLYKYREATADRAVTDIPLGVSALIQPYRNIL
ncbi:hypothetical protein EYB45_08470 [Erythrobacteraceae bacterium CFH 75059]|uniref:head-tail connector protein n=1 Tax=Qipengyuania thermophila TaxID=2509361 RepID=UPI00101F227B|nr:head-tail connector protein [Qipengyuania thermophila]TCD04272.1 hypothetical protein EYB45_08470 [Erythrobacteraceae bacterium CFH 75059]